MKPITRDCRHPKKKKTNLYQGFCFASIYLTKFWQLMCNFNWNEKSCINQLHWGLWDDLNDLMFTMPKVNALSEFIIQVVACDNWLFEKQLILFFFDLLQGYSRTHLQIFNLHFIGNNGWQSYTSGCCMLQAFHSKRWTMLTTIKALLALWRT